MMVAYLQKKKVAYLQCYPADDEKIATIPNGRISAKNDFAKNESANFPEV